MQALTQRQKQVLDFIQFTQRDSGLAPSLREIAQQFGFRSMTAAADHVRALRKKGYLIHHPRRARAHAVPAEMRDPTRGAAVVPLYGPEFTGVSARSRAAAAGSVIVDLAKLGLASAETLFALEVRTPVLVGRHILEGDVAIVDWSLTPGPGDIVSLMVEGRGTFRVLEGIKPGGGGARSVAAGELGVESAGASSTGAVQIQGVVVGLIRRCR